MRLIFILDLLIFYNLNGCCQANLSLISCISLFCPLHTFLSQHNIQLSCVALSWHAFVLLPNQQYITYSARITFLSHYSTPGTSSTNHDNSHVCSNCWLCATSCTSERSIPIAHSIYVSFRMSYFINDHFNKFI